MSGVFPRGGERLFSVLRVGLVGFRRSLQLRGNVFLGAVGLLRMKSHRWMTMGNLCSLVSGVVAIMIASMWRMLSDMRRGRSW
jgi:hypothetical protein